MLLRERVEVGLVLEEVGVELLLGKREIRLHVVVELDHLHLDAFLFKLRRDKVDDVGVRNRRNAHLERNRLRSSVRLRLGGSALVAAAGKTDSDAGGKSEGSKKPGELHGKILLVWHACFARRSGRRKQAFLNLGKRFRTASERGFPTCFRTEDEELRELRRETSGRIRL